MRTLVLALCVALTALGQTKIDIVNQTAGNLPAARVSGTVSAATSASSATTAGALAANGANCAGGQAAAGVDASGAAEGCFTPGGGSSITRTSLTFSATPVFARVSAIQQWVMVLTGNVTSSTTSGLTNGDLLTMELCQDATGGRTFVKPTGFSAMGDIDLGPNMCSVQEFRWNSASSTAVPAGGMEVYDSTGGTPGSFASFKGATSGAVTVSAPPVAGTSTQARLPGASGQLARLHVDDLSAAQFCSDAGSTDAYACTLPVIAPAAAPSSYTTGTKYRFKANTANTGAATVNFSSLGAKTIKKVVGGITTDLADNDIRAGQWVDLTYDGTNMQMTSPLGNAPAGGGGGLDLSTTGHCFFLDGCVYPAHTIATFSALANKVYMVQVVIPASLRRGSAKVFVYDGGTSGQAAAFSIHADSSNTPGSQLTTWRVVDWSSSRYVSVTLDAATQSTGVFWLAWAAEVATLRSYTRSVGDAFLGNNGPLMVSCSNTATGTGGSYAMPSTCGTASAEGNIAAPIVMIVP